MPRVSICIPFHNAERTLLGAVRSVFAQTFLDWELILFNDGSTDGSPDIARAIHDSRVRLVMSTRRMGLVRALNRLALLARGEYLARMDADDAMHPDRLTRQVAYLDANPRVDVVGSAAYVVDGAGRVGGVRRHSAPLLEWRNVLRHGPLMHPTVTGRTEWFRQHPYNESFPRAEDRELWCRTWTESVFGHIAEPLLFYTDAPGATRKYAESCRSEVRIWRKYGPGAVGRGGTAALIARSCAKPLAYSAIAAAGFEELLLKRRNAPLTSAQEREAQRALRVIAATVVPRT